MGKIAVHNNLFFIIILPLLCTIVLGVDKGLIVKETAVLHRWRCGKRMFGSFNRADNVDLATVKRFECWRFERLALHQRESRNQVGCVWFIYSEQWSFMHTMGGNMVT